MFFLILELLSCILSEDNNLILGVSILVTVKIKYIRDRHELNYWAAILYRRLVGFKAE